MRKNSVTPGLSVGCPYLSRKTKNTVLSYVKGAGYRMNDVKAVVSAQEYIKAHHTDMEFGVDSVCSEVGYSRRQLDRLFQKHTGITLYEYINAVLLSESAAKLVNSDEPVIDVALDYHYQSHEGYTRSFAKRFSVTPSEYRKNKIAIPIFTQHPANHYYILKEGQTMDNATVCTVTPVNRPKRKLIYLTSRSASDYFSYCEEIGCAWEGLLNSIPEKFDTAALIDLPDFLQENGISKIASGVEVPLDYDKPLPEGYKIAELPECTMLYFQSEPYENPDDFGRYIGQVFRAISNYDFERYGYVLAHDIAPSLNLGADTKTGARSAVPVIKK